MKTMTLEETKQQINTIVDQLLVSFAKDPTSRYLFTLPTLTEGYEGETLLDCQEYGFGIARLREVITYKYLLGALKSKLLDVNQENLAACLINMRRSPVIDYYDLADYHEYAYYHYKKLGNEKKANAHLLSCYFDRGRAFLSCDKTFDCKELLLVLLKDRQRLLSFLLYVCDYILNDFEDNQEFLKRSQYILMERALVLAEKVFAENAACKPNLRGCIYFVEYKYYQQTKRLDMALKAKAASKKFASKRPYKKIFQEIVETQLDLHWEDERFLDYILYGATLDDDEICALDDDGNVTLDIDDDSSVWEKDERMNFMDAYYREMEDAMNFKKNYDKAEEGDQQAIRELVRCYREGDGVIACECAAEAWEKTLI